jgi:peroxiredoxin Q/BCP
MTMPQVGEMAPDFDLPTSGGGRLRLSDLRGKWVVLWFFPRADTPG